MEIGNTVGLLLDGWIVGLDVGVVVLGLKVG
jgi:hypothetical protein